MATRVNSGSNSITTGTSVSATMSGAPTAGNLLHAVYYPGSTNTVSTASTPTGWTRYEATGGTGGSTASPVILFYRVVVAGDGTSWTFTASVSGFQAVFIGEYDSGAGAWSATPKDQQGNNSVASGTSLATTATAANAQAVDLAIAGVGVSGTPGFSTTWTGGFVDGGTVVGSRLTHATKTTASVETSTTTITWTTAGAGHGALGTFLQPAAAATSAPPIRRASPVPMIRAANF